MANAPADLSRLLEQIEQFKGVESISELQWVEYHERNLSDFQIQALLRDGCIPPELDVRESAIRVPDLGRELAPELLGHEQFLRCSNDLLPYPCYEISAGRLLRDETYMSAGEWFYTVPKVTSYYFDLYTYWHALFDAGMPCSFYTWLRLEGLPLKQCQTTYPSLVEPSSIPPNSPEFARARKIYYDAYGGIKPRLIFRVWEKAIASLIVLDKVFKAAGVDPQTDDTAYDMAIDSCKSDGRHTVLTARVSSEKRTHTAEVELLESVYAYPPLPEMERRVRRLCLSFLCAAQFVHKWRRIRKCGLDEVVTHAQKELSEKYNTWLEHARPIWTSLPVYEGFELPARDRARVCDGAHRASSDHVNTSEYF